MCIYIYIYIYICIHSVRTTPLRARSALKTYYVEQMPHKPKALRKPVVLGAVMALCSWNGTS